MSPPRADGYGRPPTPQVDRSEIRAHLCTRRAGARVRTCRAGMSGVVVCFCGRRPLGSSPRVVVSNSPSCPSSFRPQHLRLAVSCGNKRPRITDWLSQEGWRRTQGPSCHKPPAGGLCAWACWSCNQSTLWRESFTQGSVARWPSTRCLTRFWLHGSSASSRSMCGGG